METKNKSEENRKLEVGKILTELEKVNPDEISKEDGLMDFEKLKNHPRVKDAMRELNRMGITRAYLMGNFFLAGMVLGHLFDN